MCKEVLKFLLAQSATEFGANPYLYRQLFLPALYEAGKTYAERLENGFDMYY
ncbi:MAG: hypothetical protein IKX77_00080 [Clostridia bacterium]|nr:hypothetical protein [Clostridia bacterium]